MGARCPRAHGQFSLWCPVFTRGVRPLGGVGAFASLHPSERAASSSIPNPCRLAPSATWAPGEAQPVQVSSCAFVLPVVPSLC